MIRRANAPLPPEHSVAFRIVTTVAVLTGLLACYTVGEVSAESAALACLGILAGMMFSYATRRKPWQWVKILLAVAVLGVFASFVHQIIGAANAGQLNSIETPLAGLFVWVQIVHSFDVPARRDLLFSLAASGALLTLGASQAVSVGFLVYLGVWLAACLIALGCSWRSMTGGLGPIAFGSLATTGLVIAVASVGFLVILPTPQAVQAITLPSSLISYLPLSDPDAVTGNGAQATEAAQSGSASGATGVGGYLGFASELDTAIRGNLGDQVLMRVRADRPGYFLGMTFDMWNGQSWMRSSPTRRLVELTSGSPFDVGSAFDTFAVTSGAAAVGGSNVGAPVGPTNIQTFYVTQPMANLLFATPDPTQVYFPEHSLIVGADGSMRSTIAMTPGTVYTVISADTALSPSELARIRPVPPSQVPAALGPDLELPPARYARVAALARKIVTAARATSTYAQVTALEAWMGRNVRYSTTIPRLLPGQDAVNNFLFVTRVGYCEQISTALAVMLRTLGIPTREAIGYVPGPFDPLSDLYEIQAKDAHAWVQVWFPGAGWQNFDPTEQVPLASPDPGAVLLSDIGRTLRNLPWAPVGGALGVLGCAFLLVPVLCWRRKRPTDWPGKVVAELERRGTAAGLRRRPTETLAEYVARLDTLGRWRAGPAATSSLRAAAALIERSAYGDYVPDASTRAFVESVVRGLSPAHGLRRSSSTQRLTPA
jgi:hypothetical protein